MSNRSKIDVKDAVHEIADGGRMNLDKVWPVPHVTGNVGPRPDTTDPHILDDILAPAPDFMNMDALPVPTRVALTDAQKRTVRVGDRVVVDIPCTRDRNRAGTVLEVIQRTGTDVSPLITLDGPPSPVVGPFRCSAHYITGFVRRGAGQQVRTLVYGTDYPTFKSWRDKHHKGTLVGYSLLGLIEHCLRGFAGIERPVHEARALARYERDGCPGLIHRPAASPRDGERRSLWDTYEEDYRLVVREKAFRRWVHKVARQITYTKKELDRMADAFEDEMAADYARSVERDIDDEWGDDPPEEPASSEPDPWDY